LAERDDIDVRRFIQPFAALDELRPKYPRCATGPPKLVSPSRRKTSSTLRNGRRRAAPVSITFSLIGELMPWAAAAR
jgi:hypothetical protein